MTDADGAFDSGPTGQMTHSVEAGGVIELPQWVKDIPPWVKPLFCPTCGPERVVFINQWAPPEGNRPPLWQCWTCGTVMGFPFRKGEEPAERIGII